VIHHNVRPFNSIKRDRRVFEFGSRVGYNVEVARTVFDNVEFVGFVFKHLGVLRSRRTGRVKRITLVLNKETIEILDDGLTKEFRIEKCM
jgi:hypothetical protein